jgi:hypothetical protein
MKKDKTNRQDNVHEIGVLMPAIQYRFLFRVKNDADNIISKQVTNLEIDYVNMEITVNVIQPAADISLQEWMMRNAGETLHVYIDTLLSTKKKEQTKLDEGATSRIEFEVDFAGHSYKLDYSSDDMAMHEMILKIK